MKLGIKIIECYSMKVQWLYDIINKIIEQNVIYITLSIFNATNNE